MTWIDHLASTIELRVMGPNGATIDAVSEPLTGDESTTSAVDIDASGRVVMAWGPPVFSAGGRNLVLQRYQIDNLIATADLPSGTWLDIDGIGAGQGWFFDLSERNGQLQLVVTFFGYQNVDESSPDRGAPLWLVGQAPIVNGVADVELLATQKQFGTLFATAFWKRYLALSL